MRSLSAEHKLGGPLTLLVFCLFTVSMLMVLLLGARVYRSVSARTTATYDQQVCLDYLAAKLRHYDSAGQVFCADFNDPDDDGAIPTLYLAEDIDGVIYHTRVYLWDGYLRELFAEAGLELEPAAGQAVLPLEGLEVSQQGRRINISCRAQGQTLELSLLLRSVEEAEDE